MFSLTCFYLSFLSYCDIASDSLLLFFFFFLFVFDFLGDLGCVVSLCPFFCISMVNSSEVKIACPSISFLFARLGGSLGVFPHLENFIFEGNCLSVVLGDLLPLLCQSLN